MYRINEVSKMANISTRTLRYYDEIGLLKPAYTNASKYRIYGENEINRLQQILFYKQLGYTLADLKDIMLNPDFNLIDSLESHKTELKTQQQKLNILLTTINNTLKDLKGENKMKDQDKFNGFREEIIEENEKKYGNELREKYGNESIDASYAKMRKLSKWEFNRAQDLAKEINNLLAKAVLTKDPSSKLAIDVCKLHQEWIKMYWTTYSEEAHFGLVTMYTKDERFKAYYEKVAAGATEFLYQSMKRYLKK